LKKQNIYVLTGGQGTGKTTFTQKIVKGLSKKGITPAGILAQGHWKENRRERFDLIDISTQEKIIFCQREKKTGWEKIRHFYINPQGQFFGENALHPGNLKNADIVVIDEVGPFEIEGKGWADSIEKLLNESELPMIWVVRESILWEVLQKWGIEPLQIFHIDENIPSKIAQEIHHYLKNKS
jgi:nucleoside-triphosphatase THEP1